MLLPKQQLQLQYCSVQEYITSQTVGQFTNSQYLLKLHKPKTKMQPGFILPTWPDSVTWHGIQRAITRHWHVVLAPTGSFGAAPIFK